MLVLPVKNIVDGTSLWTGKNQCVGLEGSFGFPRTGPYYNEWSPVKVCFHQSEFMVDICLILEILRHVEDRVEAAPCVMPSVAAHVGVDALQRRLRFLS